MLDFLHCIPHYKRCRSLIKGAISLAAVCTTTCCFADGFVVFDPLNYNQSLLTAMRSLRQINIETMSLTKQTQMLINSTKNVMRAPENIAEKLRASVDEIIHLMSQTNGLAFKVNMTAN